MSGSPDLSTGPTSVWGVLREDRDWVLLWSTLFFLVLWWFATGPLRWLMEDPDLHIQWSLGVAPNFFAGAALTLWQAFGTRTGPIASVVLALTVLAGVECLQIFLPMHRADPWDLAASLLGALPAMLIVWWRSTSHDGSPETDRTPRTLP